jgi:hypothetical protein
MPINVSNGDDWTYQTITGMVKYEPILGDLGNYVKSNVQSNAMLTTVRVAAMQILTLAVPFSEAYNTALENFNKSAKRCQDQDYPMQKPFEYSQDHANHKHIVFRNSLSTPKKISAVFESLYDLQNDSPVHQSVHLDIKDLESSGNIFYRPSHRVVLKNVTGIRLFLLAQKTEFKLGTR